MLQYLQVPRIPEAACKKAAEPDSVWQDVFGTSHPLVWHRLATTATVTSFCSHVDLREKILLPKHSSRKEEGFLEGSLDPGWLKDYKIHIKMEEGVGR